MSGAWSTSGPPVVVLQTCGGRRSVAFWDPGLVVDRHPEAPRRPFDPMSVEVDACLRLGSLLVDAATAPALMGVLEVRESPVLPSPNEP